MLDGDYIACRLDYSFRSHLGDYPETYLTRIDGVIRLSLDEGSEKVGTFSVFYVDLEAGGLEGYSPDFILDLTANTYPYFPALFDSETLQLNEKCQEYAAMGSYNDNLLIIDRLEILPSHRGRRLGLVVLDRIVKQLRHGCALVAMKVFPLQFEYNSREGKRDEWYEEMEMGSFPSNEPEARQKLVQYYKLLGFRDTGQEGVIVLNPWIVE